MEANNYIPRIFEGDLNFVGSKKVDSSKWNAIHRAVDNPGSEVVHSPSSIGSLFRVAWIVGIVLGLTWIMRNGRTVFTQWQQNMYRRANRRRHGIPDSDNRPFNIAYAAAALAKKERQRAEQEKAKAQIANESRRDSTTSLRFRQSMPSEDHKSPIQLAFPSISDTQTRTLQELNTYRPNNRPRLPGGYPSENQELRQRRFIQPDVEPTGEQRLGHPVRVRSQRGRDFVELDGERHGGLPNKYREVAQAANRGHKRQVDEEDKWEASLDKRARVESTPKSHDQDVEMIPASSDPELSKGIKRDREELESTPDSGADESDESPQPRRIRQRREPAGRKEVRDETIRTHKRRHSQEESTASDERDKPDFHVSKHRKKIVMGHDTTESEAEDVKEYSEDPACVNRKIGEVWEVNGQTFKVGLDGRRLRQVLVKQRRSRFPMPKDSTHSDVKADMEVFVEKWLNDEEYKSAKENLELAWQSSSPSTPINGTQELRQSTGKRLLWDGPPKSPVKGRKSMHASTIQNPFDLALSNASRRVSSMHMLAGHAGENPQLRTSKSFSKWEKQDLEALSLRKIRERMEKEKSGQEPVKDKRVGLGDGKPTTTSGAAPPGITLTPPTDKQTGTTVSLISAPATTAPTSTFVSATVPTKQVPTPAPSSFTFGSEGSKPSTAPAPSSFNFGTVSQRPSSAPTSAQSTTTATTTSPNIFTFGATTATPFQGSKPEPPKFSFPTTAGPTVPKSFNLSSVPGASTTAAATGSTSTEAGAKPPSFAPPAQRSKGDSAQSKVAPTPGSTPLSFNFTAPTSNGSETPKFTFGNTLKSGNESAPSNTMSSASTATATPTYTAGVSNPAKFTFGPTPSFPQQTSGPFIKPAADTGLVAPASTSAPVSATAPAKPAERQSSTSLFNPVGPQISTSQPTSSTQTFGGFGAPATQPDQTTAKPSPFIFGAKESSDVAKPTAPNVFVSPASISEPSKAASFPVATEPKKSIFGGQSNIDFSTSKNIFGNHPSTGQSTFGAVGSSEQTKNAFGQPVPSASAFGQTSGVKTPFGQSNLTPAQSSDSKSVFGQTSGATSPFGQTPQAASAFTQPSEHKFTFGQSSEPKSAFGQPNPFGRPSSTEPTKTPFGQTSATGPTKFTFGPTPASSTDPSKNIFGQGSASMPKSVFGQPSELSKPSTNQVSTFSPTMNFGNNTGTNTTTSATLGSAEGTLNPSAAGSSGFKFAFGSGSTPTSFAGFGGAASENKQNVSNQPKPAENVRSSTNPGFTGFNQTTGSNPSPASTSAFGSSNALNPGSFGQPFAPTSGNSSLVGDQTSQPAGGSTSTPQTTTSSSNVFNFKPS